MSGGEDAIVPGLILLYACVGVLLHMFGLSLLGLMVALIPIISFIMMYIDNEYSSSSDNKEVYQPHQLDYYSSIWNEIPDYLHQLDIRIGQSLEYYYRQLHRQTIRPHRTRRRKGRKAKGPTINEAIKALVEMD
ncbi:hypothetical protein DRO69_10955 [Candidatus Bathyarchaeota archaeon]|nr:MAG: hypothetical protein DRO69_10955 [Candidatus Bathyarchaeota archaeon]